MKKIILLISATLLFALNTNEIKKIYYKSYDYEKMADYKDAIKVLIPLYNKYPKGYTLNLRLAYLFYLNKNYENAIKHYKTASLYYPTSIEAKLGLMKTYYNLNKFNDILKIGNELLRIDYYNFYGNYYEVLGLIGIKNYKTALSITNKMLALYPTNVLYLTKLAELYNLTNQKAKAKTTFENVLILDPNNVKAKEFLNENH